MTVNPVDKKLRVLVVTDFFEPGYKGGGPIQSIAGLVKHLDKTIKFDVLTRSHDLGDTETYPTVSINQWTQKNDHRVFYANDRLFNVFTIRKLLQNRRYNVVYLNSFFAVLSVCTVLAYKLRLLDVDKILLAPRGELFDGALEMKSRKKKMFVSLIKLFRIYQDVEWDATNKHESMAIERLFGRQKHNKIHISNELKNIMAHAPADNSARLLSLGKVLKIIVVARIARNKNLLYSLEVVSKLDFPVEFDIFGPIEDEVYWKECQAEMEKLPKNIKATYKGELLAKDVVPTMTQYHCFLMPTKGENFGHSIVEAMLAGCVIVISDQTQWNAINGLGLGYTIELSDVTGYVNSLRSIYSFNYDKFVVIEFGIKNYIEKNLNTKDELEINTGKFSTC